LIKNAKFEATNPLLGTFKGKIEIRSKHTPLGQIFATVCQNSVNQSIN